MKKFFYLMASVAVLALCFTSCKEKNKPEPEPTPEPQPEVATIAVTIDAVSYTEFDFTVIPSDTTKTFISSWYDPAGVEGKTNEQLQAMIKEEIDGYIEYLIANGEEDATYADFLRSGKKSLYFSELEPGTEYVVVVTYMDAEGNCSGTVGKATAKTKDIVAPTGQVVTLEGLEGIYIDDWRDYDGSYIIYFDDASFDNELALCLFDEDFAGEFGMDDIDGDYSYVWPIDEETTLPIQALDVTATLSTDGKKSTYAGSVIGYNGIQYNFSADVNLAELLDGFDDGDDDDDDAGFAPRRVVKKKGLKTFKKLARAK